TGPRPAHRGAAACRGSLRARARRGPRARRRQEARPHPGRWRLAHARHRHRRCPRLQTRRTWHGTGGLPLLHSAVDDYSRLAYTEALDDEKADTAVGFWLRAVAFFAEHGITPIHRVLTDNGSCYRSRAWAAAVASTDTK